MQEELEQGRDAYRRREWRHAYESLSRADRSAPLGVEDLELLATATYMIGRELDFCRFLERAHGAHRDGGGRAPAARCAFWLGMVLLLRGENGRASGWLARAQRLVEDLDCAEKGYLLLPVAEEQIARGRGDAAYTAATAAAEVGDRFADADLLACARHLQGRALIRLGQIHEGLVYLDEAMLAAVGGELSPIMTGLVYCSLIEVCHDVYAHGRAREWTAALARWCEQQPQMVAFTATCLVRRAQVMALSGAWSDAMAEARRACERAASEGGGGRPPASALYQQAELARLRGEFAAAEKAYRDAARLGWEPQPGLALLRMAQGRTDAACAAIRRVLSATTDPLKRARLLPACVEILLAAGDIPEARVASHELEEIAGKLDAEVLRAFAAQARGAIELTEGNARAALAPLGRALDLWRRIEAPYEVARVRVLIALACRSLGDDEAARLEIGQARVAFEALGAAPDVARLDTLGQPAVPAGRRGLTPRELQVLRLIAAGKTNKAIAGELFVSERTVDRHVSNILTKLDVSSRAGATAYAYEHRLL